MYLVCEPNSGQCVPPYVDCNSGWCFIPAGTFLMGSPEDDPERYNNEGPTYIATITRDFYMSQTEVTQEQWESVFQNNPSSTTECGVDCPVETVNWFEAVAYANALSDKEGREKCYTIEGCSGSPGTGLKNCTVTYSNLLDCKGYRLPTETEWEYAARAGTSEPRYGEVDRIAWHVGNSQRTYHPVAKLLPNAWGLYDMLGNVWEWVHDYYDFYNTSISGGIDPLGPSWGAGRVRRGGGWIFDARNSRAADRSYDTPDTRRSYIGLRIVRTAP
ncbi:MAG: formylglycine-generating enzyme family protein [Myxococcota bacterium]|nr:formylglycine-generating enzyme family protein [Oligoflexales bacterium]